MAVVDFIQSRIAPPDSLQGLARLRYWVLTGALAIAAFYGVVLLLPLAFVYPQYASRFLLFGISLPTVAWTLHRMALAGRLEAASWLGLSFYWLLSAYGIATSGGSQSSAFILHILLVLLGGMLVGLRVGVVLAVLDSVCVLAYELAVRSGWQPPTRPDLPWIQAANAMQGFVITMLLLVTASYLIRKTGERLDEATRKALDQQELFRTIFDLAPCGLSIRSLDGAYLELNREAQNLIGLPRERILGRKPSELGMRLAGDRLDELRDRLREQESIDNLPLSYWRPVDGERFELLYSARPLTLNGEPRMLTVNADVTAHHLAEEQLQREKAFNDAVLESLPGKFFVLDGEGRLMRWNQEYERSSGRGAEELIGASGFEMLAEEDHALAGQALASILVEGHAEVEARFRDASGSLHPHFFSTRLLQSDPPIIICWGLDISERKRLEQQFLQAQKMEAVGRLAGGVAHDFNNVLTVIGGTAELLQDDGTANASLREGMETILEAVQHATSLTRQLLAFSRQQVVQPRSLDLNELIQRLDKILRRLIGEDVRLELTLGRDIGPVVADPGQLEQVLFNLAVNARDAMPGGGHLKIETVRYIQTEPESSLHPDLKIGPHALLIVSDTGEGMTREIQERIFDPFFTTKDVGRGTGLGLATVMGIVKQNAGHIGVYSEPGVGTAFRIYLPESEERKATDGGAGPAPASGGDETILLVEDEEAVRKLVERVLARLGYTVLVAGSGPEALQVARNADRAIDLLLTDIVMPGGMTGADLALDLVELQPGLKVVCMSGYTSSLLDDRVFMQLKSSLLQKPFTSEQLGRQVREALDGPPPTLG